MFLNQILGTSIAAPGDMNKRTWASVGFKFLLFLPLPNLVHAAICVDLFENQAELLFQAKKIILKAPSNLHGSMGVGGFDTFQSFIEAIQYYPRALPASPKQLFFSKISLEQGLQMHGETRRTDINLSLDLKQMNWRFWDSKHGVFKDLQELLKFSSFSFIMPQFPDSRKVQMVLHVKASDGTREVYSQEFTTSKRLDWVSLDVAKFSRIRRGSKEDDKITLLEMVENGAELESYGFVLATDGLPTDPKTFLPTSIAYELNFPNHIDPVKLLSLEPYAPHPLRIADGLGGFVVLKKSEVRSVFSKFFQSMKRRENQERARAVIRQGLPTVQAELAKYGWSSTKRLDKKVNVATFMIDFFAQREIPLEAGEFSEIHSIFAHHAQFLAGFYGLTEREVAIVSEVIVRFIAERKGEFHRGFAPFHNWPLWGPLFDGRGNNSVHSNRFWRDFLDKE